MLAVLLISQLCQSSFCYIRITGLGLLIWVTEFVQEVPTFVQKPVSTTLTVCVALPWLTGVITAMSWCYLFCVCVLALCGAGFPSRRSYSAGKTAAYDSITGLR